jgi:exopolysaccharide biosynthesis polyprenyl glycosylphosphotransferase
MAVATQQITTLRAPRSVTTLPRVQANLAPRWLAPALLATIDTLALAVAVLLVGSNSTLVLLYVPLALASLGICGAYRPRLTLQALEAAPWLACRLAVPLLVLAPAVWLGTNLSSLVEVALIGAVALVLGRVLSYGVLRRTRRVASMLEPTIILGAGEIGVELSIAFRDFPEFGVTPVGFLDCVNDNDLPFPVLGDVDRLDDLLRGTDIRRVIVAFGPAREAELVGVLRTAVQHDVDVHVVPRFFDCGVSPSGPETDDVRGIPLYRVRRAALRAPAWALKRLVDVVVAGTVLVVTAPVLALIAVAVKLSSPGPVLFRQKRIGQHGEEIDIVKFRSLAVNHDSETRWSVDDDPRVTFVGRLLRATSIDELPQVWSVFRGRMSLVGPRPERPFFVERFGASIDGYGDRHRLPVGLTGWAQVHGLRGDTSIEERARYDNQYIEHWSLWRDLVIMLRTVAEVLRSARTHTSNDHA